MPKVDIEEIKDKLGFGADKVYAVMGEFSDPHDLVHAGRKIREMGYTKIDAMTPREASARAAALRKASGRPVMLLSGVSGQGVPEVLRAVQNTINEARRKAAA